METKIGVLSIESPVRRKDHSYVPYPHMQALSSLAREHGPTAEVGRPVVTISVPSA
mgnify:CR=1 FL=1